MIDMIDKIIIFICCLTLHICNPNVQQEIAPVLIAVITSANCSYFDKLKTRVTIIVCFIVLCVFIPELTIFLPLICYDGLLQKYQLVCLLGLVPLILFLQTAVPIVGAVTCILLVLCALLKYRMVTLTKMQAEFYDLRDSTKEMSMQLKKQNTDLLEKQDYEINIATLNERNRIAREIHDNVGHLLSSSILQVGALLAINKEERVKENLLIVNDTLSQAMNSIRTSVHDLYDESIDLHEQVNNIVNKFTFCKLNFDYDIQSNPERKLKYAFISIVKEALTNMIKHSNATEASVMFREHPALYQLIIFDNGTAKKMNSDNGIGLKNITERVDSFRGNINISTKNGFEIFISIPKKGANE